MVRILRVVGWGLFGLSLLAGLFGVFGGALADNYPWLFVCIASWIISMFVLAYARRRAIAAIVGDDKD